jgi:hypothetical protein
VLKELWVEVAVEAGGKVAGCRPPRDCVRESHNQAGLARQQHWRAAGQIDLDDLGAPSLSSVRHRRRSHRHRMQHVCSVCEREREIHTSTYKHTHNTSRYMQVSGMACAVGTRERGQVGLQYVRAHT